MCKAYFRRATIFFWISGLRKTNYSWDPIVRTQDAAEFFRNFHKGTVLYLKF